MIAVETIADSIGSRSPRLWTVKTTYPKFVHQETLRHRLIYCEDVLRGDFDFSLSVSSSRAIPFSKLLDEVKQNIRAKPVKWGAEQKGMSPGDEVPKSAIHDAEYIWENAALSAANHARELAALGVHKSICNRIIEPYIHVHALYTATEPGWMNFFGLRLDPAADPTLRALAEALWREWNEHQPNKVGPGQWHLPFIDALTVMELETDLMTVTKEDINNLIKISVARCARLSYESFVTKRRLTIEEDLELYNRLVGSAPIHASPAEHQATPDTLRWQHPDIPAAQEWEKPYLCGNFGPGWIQYRKTLPSESLAPLPQEYRQ